MLLPGVTISTGATDFAKIKQMQLSKFDGKTFELFGDVISAAGN
jgi:branched-chain amino acid transport system substrate-binding protein